MKNKKVFIGNLSFQITEEEVRNLFSEFGTVVNIKMNRKKGFAIVEMDDTAEAAKAIEKLQGVMHRDREIRVSPEMRAGKAKSLTIKSYQERSDKIFRKKRKGSDTRSRRQKQKDAVKAHQENMKNRSPRKQDK